MAQKKLGGGRNRGKSREGGEEMWGKRLGRREKLAQKVGRREIYFPVPPPSFEWQKSPLYPRPALVWNIAKNFAMNPALSQERCLNPSTFPNRWIEDEPLSPTRRANCTFYCKTTIHGYLSCFFFCYLLVRIYAVNNTTQVFNDTCVWSRGFTFHLLSTMSLRFLYGPYQTSQTR